MGRRIAMSSNEADLFGIVIRMYHNDHAPPHFHASYLGFEALLGIADGSV